MATFFLFVGSFKEAGERKKNTLGLQKPRQDSPKLGWTAGGRKPTESADLCHENRSGLGVLILQCITVMVLNEHLWREGDKSIDEHVGAFDMNNTECWTFPLRKKKKKNQDKNLNL